MSRQKQLNVVFGVANAQKQGVIEARLALRVARLCFKREQVIKRLITVFNEAMSRVASRASEACLTKLCDTKADGGSASFGYRNLASIENYIEA